MRAREISLPQSWPATVRSAILHVIALAQYATAYTRSWTADSRNARMRLQAENDRLQQELSLLNEELRIKDARMRLIDPRRRPSSRRRSAPFIFSRTQWNNPANPIPQNRLHTWNDTVKK